MSAETPRIEMQLVRNGKDVVLDMRPPIDDERLGLTRTVLSGYHVPVEAFIFRDILEPRGTEPFTEINCTTARTEAEEAGHSLDEQEFAKEVGEILVKNGYEVEFDPTQIVPMERSRRLLGLS
jgi:hypothetical protein